MSDIPPPVHSQALQASAVPSTSFVGREPEIALVTALLVRPEVRLLTLTGPGGIGKTRLALQVGEHVREQFADGLVVVPLASVQDPERVLPAVAQTLGVPDAPGQALITRLQTFLHDRHMLLVLDNLEHLLEAAAPLVVELLARCSRLTVLGTSRTRLGISSEQVVPLDALSPEAARQLFTERAQAVMPSCAVTGEMTPTIDAICARLDRVPLAVELAASRTPVLPPRVLLARLDHRLDLLTGGPRDAPARQRTMRDTIAWSYGLLNDEHRALFQRLGVFVGGFTLEAAQTVASEDEDVLAGISALVTASLVTPVEGIGDEPRFTMLETIREYALEQLAASGDEQPIRKSHLDHFVALAEQMWAAATGRETHHWYQRLAPEAGNIRAALSWALEHEPAEAARLAGSLDVYWNFSSSFAEGRDWIERSLAVATMIPPHVRARALATAGWMELEQGNLMQAEAYLTEAVDLARALSDDRLHVVALMHIGKIEHGRGHLETAWRIFEDEQRRAAASGVHADEVVATLNLGMVAMSMGDLQRAQALLQEALRIHQASGSALGVAVAQTCLGSIALARGDHTAAAAHFLNSFRYFASIRDWANIARTLEGIAGAVVSHQPDPATQLLGTAATMRERVGRPRNKADDSAYEETEKTARMLLSKVAFANAWEVGRSLSWEQVLSEVDSLVTTDIQPRTVPRLEADPHHGLTRREMEVVRLLAEGRTSREIADALSISERTVEGHVLHILTKLDLPSRAAAAAFAVRHGLA
jgi:predicted ATPase/DNA-binding CsgD family transcriptional regulator